jgi:hypothetical protein
MVTNTWHAATQLFRCSSKSTPVGMSPKSTNRFSRPNACVSRSCSRPAVPIESSLRQLMKIVPAMAPLGSPNPPKIYWRTSQNTMTWCTAFSLFRGKPMSTTDLRLAVCGRPFRRNPASHATFWFAKRRRGELVHQEGRRSFSVRVAEDHKSLNSVLHGPLRKPLVSTLYSRFACVVLAKVARRPT